MTRRPTLAGRLLARYALTIVGLLLALGIVLDRIVESAFLDDLTDSLQVQAGAVQAALPPEDELLQPRVQGLGERLDVRITVIRTDGLVLADSSRDPATMENHRTRPEVAEALAGDVGVDSRTSETVGVPFRYVALPPEGDRIVRLAIPLSIVASRLARVRALISTAFLVASAIGVGAVWLVARSLGRPFRDMIASVRAMSAGELSARAPGGPVAELALLAETLNRMATELGDRMREVEEDRRSRELILAAMDEGVILSEGGRVVYVNPAARRLLGRGTDESRDLSPPSLGRLVHDAAASREPRREELQIGLPPRTILASAVGVGEPERVLLVLRDVTDARRLESVRRDFVADASHELKTPVAAIRASAETVRRALHEDPDAARGFADRLAREAVRLSRIVADLLDLSRVESEEMEPEVVRLDGVVAEEVDRIRERAGEAGVDLEVGLDAVTVRGDRKDLGLLAANLLDNAIRYSGSGGRVRVETVARDGTAVLTVADTGIGIPSRDLPRVFERFYRVDRARSRETGGTGLGLSIARHVAERHGGRIEVESELGRGSTFTVELPAIPSPS